MGYRVTNAIVNSEGDFIEEGEIVRITLDDESVLIGFIEDIFYNEETLDICCEYFTVNIGVHRITSITKE